MWYTSRRRAVLVRGSWQLRFDQVNQKLRQGGWISNILRQKPPCKVALVAEAVAKQNGRGNRGPHTSDKIFLQAISTKLPGSIQC